MVWISNKTPEQIETQRQTKKEWHRKYNSRPEIKEKRRIYMKEYWKRPGIREANREAQRRYRQRKNNQSL